MLLVFLITSCLCYLFSLQEGAAPLSGIVACVSGALLSGADVLEYASFGSAEVSRPIFPHVVLCESDLSSAVSEPQRFEAEMLSVEVLVV